MTDESQVEMPKRRGWPKGKPRMKKTTGSPGEPLAARSASAAASSMLSKMKSRPNWEDENFVGVGVDGVDRLRIPPEMVRALARDGVALQWITKSVRGQEMPQEQSKFTRGGWTPVHQSDFDGVLDGMFLPKGSDDVIVVDDCMLVARPIQIHNKARQAEHREANRPLQIAEEQIGHGIQNVTGSTHPSATRGNIINKTVERIEIPE